MIAHTGQKVAPPGAGARTVSLFSAEKREMVLDSKEKRFWLIIGASTFSTRRPGLAGLLVEVAATGRHDAVPGIGLVLLLQPPRPPLGTRIRGPFSLPFTFFHSTAHNPTIPPSSTHNRTLRFCLTRKKRTLPAQQGRESFCLVETIKEEGSNSPTLHFTGGHGDYNRNATHRQRTTLCRPVAAFSTSNPVLQGRRG